MPSGKQSKRRRAAPAPPPSRGARRASPRVLAIAGAILAVALAAVVVGVGLSRGESDDTAEPPRGSPRNALPGAVETQQALKGVPQAGNILGKPTAPVTIYEYVDPQCPFCEQFETQAMPGLIERYVRPGKAKVVLRPLAFIGADSERGRAAMIAAAEQNKLFDVTQLLFLNQGAENSGWLDDGLVERIGASVPGLDVPRFLADRDASSVAAKANTFDAEASTDGVTSTPTILVGKSGQPATAVALTTVTDGETVASAIDAALR